MDEAQKIELMNEASNTYRRALDMEPKNAETWKNYGVALTIVGQWEKSRTALETALKLKQDDPELYIALADVSLRGFNDKQKALFYVNRALQLNLSAQTRQYLENLRTTIMK